MNSGFNVQTAEAEQKINKEPKIPVDINDPLALETDWETLTYKTGSENMMKLKLDSRNDMLSLVLSRDACFIYGCFIIFGLGLAVFFAWLLMTADFELIRALGVMAGSIFFFVGIDFFRKHTKPHNFDKSSGYYWKGWTKPDLYRIGQDDKNIPLKNIHAIQLLKTNCGGPDNPTRGVVNYELNLILKDASRLMLPKYMFKKKAQDHAKALAEFLQVPVWDAT